MLFLNLKRIFLTVMFLAGVATLFIGYNSIAGMFLKDMAVMKNTHIGPLDTGVILQDDAVLESQGPSVSSSSSGVDSFMVEYRLQRERSRGQQIELLREIINSPSLGGDTKRLAQEQLFTISKSLAVESRIENLLKAGGYKDAVAYMDEKGVTLVVESLGLSPVEEEKIVALAARESGYGEPSIKVVSNNQ